MARMVHCIKLGTEAEGLDLPPYPGELGQRIWASVSKQAWQEWLRQQTMLVNENRLNLADQRARQYLARQMEKFFFGEGAEQPAGYVPPSASASASRGLDLAQTNATENDSRLWIECGRPTQEPA